ncbi:MAG: hypothetical protein ABSG98_05955 [Anaerolineales bacterium]
MDTREKSSLRKFESKVLDGVGEFLARMGGKNTLAAASGLSLLVTACIEATKPLSGPIPEEQTPTVQIVSSTIERSPIVEPPQRSEPTATPELGNSQYDIFQPETWPEQDLIVAKDPVSATDAEWKDYKDFLDKTRWAFLGKEGISQDFIENLPGIDKELSSLWGMVYWEQTHKQEVVDKKLLIQFSPSEYIYLLEHPTEVPYDPDSPNYFFDLIGGGFSSGEVGGILGRSGVYIPREYFEYDGDLAAVGTMTYGDPGNAVLIIHARNKAGSIHELQPVVVLFEDVTVPAGTGCVCWVPPGMTRVMDVRPLPAQGRLEKVSGWVTDREYSLEDFLGGIDSVVGAIPLGIDLGLGRSAGTYANCIYPELHVEVAQQVTILWKTPVGSWPWEK